jgi:linoleoyl-CoA desaturase
MASDPSAPRARFPSQGTLGAELRAEVDAWFDERGLSPHANAAMVVKTLTLLGTCVGSYLLLILVPMAGLAQLGLCVVLGVALAGIGMAVGHDALHGAYARHRWVNRLVGHSFDLIGANSYIWRLTHNLTHHGYTNVEGTDLDLDYAPVMRTSPSAPRAHLHRFQHFYAPLLYSIASAHWLFVKDASYYMKRPLGAVARPRHSVWAWLGLVVGKVYAFGIYLVLPLLLVDRPWPAVLAGVAVMLLTSGLTLSTVFQVAHMFPQATFPKPNEKGVLPEGFVAHQLRTTMNFACENRAISWLVGGLNFQVEHHLFPHICSIHYPKLRPIVRDFARSHGLPYHEVPTLAGAVAAHLQHLRALGRPEAAASTVAHAPSYAMSTRSASPSVSEVEPVEAIS